MKHRKLLSFLLAVMMIFPMVTIVLPTPTGAVTPFIDIDPGDYFRFMITVSWNVVSANDHEDIYFNVPCYTFFEETSSLNNAYGGESENHKYEKAARESGNHTWSFLSNGCPSGLYYYTYGRTANPTEWYITKITVTPLKPVEGYDKKAYTYWEGKLGLRVASMGGMHNSNSVLFASGEAPNFKGWTTLSVGTEFTAYTNDWELPPYIYGILPVEGPSTIDVPTNGDSVSYDYSHGLIYDNFGAEWPIQDLNIVETRQYVSDSYVGSDYFSHTGVSFSNNKNTVTLTPEANAKNDYKFLIIYKDHRTRDYFEHKVVTVKTFDYNVTFKDAYGNTLKTETVDYGGSATPPQAPPVTFRDGKLCAFSGWTGDSYGNIKDGPQDRVVTAFYNTDTSQYLPGSGTSDDPYLISNANDWNLFRLYCSADATSGKYFKLTNNVYIDNVMAGESGHDFQGIFDGDGHTLTVQIGSSGRPGNSDYLAPFAYTKDATIQNLHTAGKIYTSGKYAGGIVGGNWGSDKTTIRNCRSSVEIISSTAGDGRHGGIVGYTGAGTAASLYIQGCVFDGKLLGPDTTGCGGLVGYRANSRKLNIQYSIFDPSEVTISDTDSAIFARNTGKTALISSKITVTKSYYLYEFGSNLDDWKEGRTISAGEGVTVGFTESNTTYSVSGITAYPSCGVKYKGNLYAGKDEEVKLSLGHTDAPTGYRFTGYSASAGTLSNYKLTMPDENVVISAVFDIYKYTVTWKNYDGTTLETDRNVPYGTVPTYDGATPTKQATAEYAYTFSGWSPEVTAVTGDTTYTAQFDESSVSDHISVSGNVYTILDSAGWSVFCTLLKDTNNNGLYGKTVELAADINVYEMAGADSDHAFRGTFYGNDHKITVNIPNNGDGTTALFGYVNGATIEHLAVDGTITGSGVHAAGLAGEAVGDTVSSIIDCRVSATISGKRYIGGFTIGGHFKIIGCTFDGKINATEKSGGFIAWGENDTVIDHCFFTPAEGSSIVGGTLYYVGNGGVTVTKTYTTAQLGEEQCMTAYKIERDIYTKLDLAGIHVWYDVSGIHLYGGNNGFKFGDDFFAGAGEVVELKLSHPERQHFVFKSYSADAGTLSGTTLTMPESDTRICSNYSLKVYTVTWVNDDGAVLETDTDVTYIDTPEYNGATPTKAADADYSYTFKGWSPKVTTVDEDTTFTAIYDRTAREYVITSWSWDGYAFAKAVFNTTEGDFTKEIDASIEPVTDAPGCISGGRTVYTATVVYGGTTYTDTNTEILKAIGHDFGEWTQTTAPTCTEAGEETRYCSRCDATENRDVAALGHDYVSVVTEPTCAEQGYTTYTCSRCGDSCVDNYTEVVDHTPGDGTVTVKPTYTEPGVMTYECTVCNAKWTEEIPPLPPLLGDVNGDGKINSKDIAHIKKYVGTTISIDEIVVVNSDINGDGKVNTKDISAVKRIVAQ